MPGPVDALLETAKFDERGLLVAIAQDARTGVVRMQAWANAEAVRATAESGLATFYSRSRAELWQKGATSGNVMRVQQIRLDCDGDAVLYLVDAEGPSCHTGKTSCFFRSLTGTTLEEDDGPPGPPATILARVAQVIAERRRSSAEKSYVATLLAAGWPKILEKIAEESRELAEALPGDDKDHTAHEAADVIFHVLVGLEAAGVPAGAVFAELGRRFGTSGLTEKANRPKPAT
jgi:phosphoribosyl-ATP pyrophosphohydrolase/phosphoribosyl-AMP cyclohydrolase